jgi:hypothetical protein
MQVEIHLTLNAQARITGLVFLQLLLLLLAFLSRISRVEEKQKTLDGQS